MNTSHGWGRARLELKGVDVKYNSLREAYLIQALRKQDKIEFKKALSMIVAMNGGEAQKAVEKYMNEAFPELQEQREEFVEQNKEILAHEAGKEIDLSKYKMIE